MFHTWQYPTEPWLEPAKGARPLGAVSRSYRVKTEAPSTASPSTRSDQVPISFLHTSGDDFLSSERLQPWWTFQGVATHPVTANSAAEAGASVRCFSLARNALLQAQPQIREAAGGRRFALDPAALHLRCTLDSWGWTDAAPVIRHLPVSARDGLIESACEAREADAPFSERPS